VAIAPTTLAKKAEITQAFEDENDAAPDQDALEEAPGVVAEAKIETQGQEKAKDRARNHNIAAVGEGRVTHPRSSGGAGHGESGQEEEQNAGQSTTKPSAQRLIGWRRTIRRVVVEGWGAVVWHALTGRMPVPRWIIQVLT